MNIWDDPSFDVNVWNNMDAQSRYALVAQWYAAQANGNTAYGLQAANNLITANPDFFHKPLDTISSGVNTNAQSSAGVESPPPPTTTTVTNTTSEDLKNTPSAVGEATPSTTISSGGNGDKAEGTTEKPVEMEKAVNIGGTNTMQPVTQMPASRSTMTNNDVVGQVNPNLKDNVERRSLGTSDEREKTRPFMNKRFGMLGRA